ncbi:MAG: putative toxin-antitoxin system toxin component, PIN family, partial [Chloroflexota bacterium]|nr:putative toxin-antitoxin system toxin component, PIN family [Chloroflexota bacterium]
MKVVIDTNVLVSRAISEKRAPATIFRLVGEGALEHIVSRALLDEYSRALEYEHVRKLHRRTSAQIVTLLSEIEEAATLVQPSTSLQVIKADPDDNKILECAVA